MENVMLIGTIIGFITWTIYLLIQTIISAASTDPKKQLDPKKILQRLGIALLAGLIWGGILKYAVTGSPH